MIHDKTWLLLTTEKESGEGRKLVTLAELERQILEFAINREGTAAYAATALGIPRATFYRRIKALGGSLSIPTAAERIAYRHRLKRNGRLKKEEEADEQENKVQETVGELQALRRP